MESIKKKLERENLNATDRAKLDRKKQDVERKQYFAGAGTSKAGYRRLTEQDTDTCKIKHVLFLMFEFIRRSASNIIKEKT